jgi:hypothetical protein
MRSAINLTILILLAIVSYLPDGSCQEVWEVIPEGSENQGNLPRGVLGEPIGLQPQSGMGYLPQSGMDSLPQSGIGYLPLPATAPPHIEFFNGPSVAKPGDIITLTWKVWDACSVYLDTDPKDAEGSYTYTVPMQGAPDTIYHQMIAYGKPCDNPAPMTKDLSIKIQQLTVPSAPNELKFTGWTKTLDGPTANFEWKDNSNDEYGFKIYNGINLVGSRGTDVTTIGIPLADSCGKAFTFHVTAFNGMGDSAPSKSVTFEGSECTDDPAEDLKSTSYQFPFSVGSNWGDGDEYYFTVYSPGSISAKANWTGTATDLDLVLEGPGNYGLHASGTSPRALSHIVTGEDLIKGYTWKISIINHIEGGTATGTISLTYPEGCCWAGTWDTNFGRMQILLYPWYQDGQSITGNYDQDKGTIQGKIVGNKITGNKLSGKWGEAPTYDLPNDAGDVELYMSEDCESFIGWWRYGYTGDWDGDWKGTRVDEGLDLRPKGHGIG